MKQPSMSLIIDFSLKSTLSDMSIATTVYLWDPFDWKNFFQPLTLSQYLFSSVR
jgi:replication initiation and membrane attachment protein DnaB